MVLKIEYPDSLADALQMTRKELEQEFRMALAVKLYEMKRLSSGMAARLVGVDRVTFLLSLNRYGVPMINAQEEEVLADIQNA
jgi:predicted HTH domain antitoxin